MNPSEEPLRDKTSPSAASVCGAFLNAFSELGRAMVPAENVERHFREARKHALMGIRELIDNRIQDLSKTENRGTRVVVE